MFNNLYNKFVADAKEEREQLDRLLTVSAPHERILLAGIGLVLIAFVTWLSLGSVMHSVQIHGVLMESSEGHNGDDQSLHAVVWLEPTIARGIETGMQTEVEVDLANGETLHMTGSLVNMEFETLPTGTEGLNAILPVALYRVAIQVGEDSNPAISVGSACRIVVKLGRQSPIVLFGFGRS